MISPDIVNSVLLVPVDQFLDSMLHSLLLNHLMIHLAMEHVDLPAIAAQLQLENLKIQNIRIKC